MKTAVIYHSPCYDGLTAAWVAWRQFRKTARYIPGSYGAEPPVFEEPTHIYILDFSFNPDIFDLWVSQGHKITILDHHQSAIDMLQPYFDKYSNNKNLEAVFDNDRSGAGITYQYFNPGKVLPRLVDLVQDRDLWRFNYGNLSRHLYSYMQFRIEFSDPIEKLFEVMDMIHESLEQQGKSPVMEKGEVLSESYYKFCRNFADNRVMVRIPDWNNGFEFPVLTTNKMFGSDTCSYIIREFKTKVSGYFFLEKANQWNWGMRSIDDFDVANLCQRYGGGGHVHAAGFVLKQPQPFPKDWEIL